VLITIDYHCTANKFGLTVDSPTVHSCDHNNQIVELWFSSIIIDASSDGKQGIN